MKWQSWLLGIAGSLVASGVGSVVAMEVQAGARAEAAEVRVHVLEARIEKHEATIESIVPLLERIDERISGVNWRLDKLEAQNEQPRRGRK